MADPDSSGRRARLGLSEGILLALSPALAYIIAFRFEASYLRWYGLPSDLIELSLDRLAASWTILLVVAFAAFTIIGSFPAGRWNLILGRVATVVIVVCQVAFLIVMRPSGGVGRWLVTALAFAVGLFGVLWILIESVVPLVKHPDLPNWLDRYAREDAVVATKTPTNVLTWAVNTGGSGVLWFWSLIFLFFISLMLAEYLGNTTARLNGRHLVVSGSPECAVIRRYGNNLVCLEIDRAAWRFGRGIRLLSMDRMPDEPLHVEVLYLRPHRDSTSVGNVGRDHGTDSTR